MTIRITVGSNLKRSTILVDDTLTPKQVFEQQDIDYSAPGCVASLDGCQLSAGDMNKSFAELGITDKAVLTTVVKADNA